MPDSLEVLDLLLLTVSTPRKVQRDGIHLHGLRYFSLTLAAYVGEPVTIRYDPRIWPRYGSTTTTVSCAGPSPPRSPPPPSR